MPFTYATLTQLHPDYDPHQIRTLRDLYVGGFQMMRHARDYLVRLPKEGDERFDLRVQTATYQPYFGQIVDQFASDLFARTFEITPASDAADPTTPGKDTTDAYYDEFAKNADGCGHSFVDVVRDVLTTALTHKRGILVVDAPELPEDGAPATKADEEELGIKRLYAYELPVEQLIDWELDSDGNLIWAIVRTVDCRRPAPGASRGKMLEAFTVWTIGEGEGKAIWERYAVEYEADKPPKAEDFVPLVAGPVATDFDAIPLHVLELPDGLWVGGKIGPPVLEHFRRRSALVGAQNDSLCAIPVASLGPEYGAPGSTPVSDAQSDPRRGADPVGAFNSKGFNVVGKDDKIYFAEPEGKAYELVDKQLKELRDDIFAVCHQMAASVRTSTTALGRSGASKLADQSSTAKVLSALGRLVRSFSLEVWSCVSLARGDDVEWSAHGLDNYENEERQDLLDEALSVAAIPIESPTFHKLHQFRLVQRIVPNATSQEYDVIRKEIDEGVDAQVELKVAEQDVRAEALKQTAEGGPPERDPGPGQPPGGKTNGAPTEIKPVQVGKKQATT